MSLYAVVAYSKNKCKLSVKAAYCKKQSCESGWLNGRSSGLTQTLITVSNPKRKALKVNDHAF